MPWLQYIGMQHTPLELCAIVSYQLFHISKLITFYFISSALHKICFKEIFTRVFSFFHLNFLDIKDYLVITIIFMKTLEYVSKLNWHKLEIWYRSGRYDLHLTSIGWKQVQIRCHKMYMCMNLNGSTMQQIVAVSVCCQSSKVRALMIQGELT